MPGEARVRDNLSGYGQWGGMLGCRSPANGKPAKGRD
jgi:hypothetical protein